MAIYNEERIPGVVHFDFEITDKNLDSTSKLLVSHIKKDWDVNSLQHKVFDDGITNKLIGYFVRNGELKVSASFGEHGRSDIILIRIYGAKTELFIDRAKELRNFQELMKNNIAPTLYCTFENGYCYRYQEGRVLSTQDMKNNVVLRESSKLMAQIHCVKLSDSYLTNHPLQSTMFDTIKKLLRLVPSEYENADKQKRFVELVPKAEQLSEEVENLKSHVSSFPNDEIVFCHNDLLLANFLFDEHSEKITCIDYEYGTPNYASYDIGNHFNEFAGVDTVDYTLYPDKNTQMSWLKMYIEELNSMKGLNERVDEKKIYNLYVRVNKMALVSHLFWGTWALVQAHHSEIDFDFMGYGIIRLNEYFRRKEEFLSLEEQA